MSLLNQIPTENLLDFFLPKFCAHCGKFGHYLCRECYHDIEFISVHYCPYCHKPSIDGLTHPGCQSPRSIDGIISAAVYRGAIRSLIKTLKYPPYSKCVYEEIDQILKRYFLNQEPLFPSSTTLTPIPLHPNKLKKRGFNQSHLIAQTLHSLWNTKISADLLIRKKEGRDQTALPRKQRLKNVRGLYAVNPKKKHLIKKGNFILVDDVVTTGATLRWCAALLKANGARKVWGVTTARD